MNPTKLKIVAQMLIDKHPFPERSACGELLELDSMSLN